MEGLRGDLGLMSMLEILVWAEDRKKTGCLKIFRQGEEKVIRFREGKVVAADPNDGDVEEMLREMLPWRDGHFEFSSVSAPTRNASDPVPSREPDRQTGDEDILFRDITRRITTGLFELPPVPEIILRIHRELQAGDGSAEEIRKIIMADQILTSKILKIANSAFYSLANPVSSLRHAIVCLGFRTVQGIVLAETLNSMCVRNRSAMREVLQHSFRCACTVRMLASETGDDLEEAFVCGLLHNIGKSVLWNLLADCSLSQGKKEEIVERHYSEAGMLLAARWNLPEIVIEVIESHRNPEGGSSRLATLVWLSNSLLEEGRFPTLTGAVATLALALDESRLSAEVPKINEMAQSLF